MRRFSAKLERGENSLCGVCSGVEVADEIALAVLREADFCVGESVLPAEEVGREVGCAIGVTAEEAATEIPLQFVAARSLVGHLLPR